MVKTNSASRTQNNKKLSIQVALNGLSFCCKNLITNEIYDFKRISFVEYSKNNTIEENLWKAFSEHNALISQYEDVSVLHQNNLNTWVPKSFFIEEQIGSYLQYNNKVFTSDYFAFDALDTHELVNVYIPYININNFLIDQFKEFDYQHYNSILVRELIKFQEFKNETKVFIHFDSNYFSLVVLNGTKLIFNNTFEYFNENDVLYYILFTAEQLGLDPDQFELNVLGLMNKDHYIFEKMYEFIRNVKILPSELLNQKFGRTSEENIENFVLFNL